MNRKTILIFLLANTLLISMASVFLVRPAVVSLGNARDNLLMAERRYAAGRIMERDYEHNLEEIESSGHMRLLYYGEFPLILSRMSQKAEENSLERTSFNAYSAADHYLGFYDSRVIETFVRAEYLGTIENIQIFLDDLDEIIITDFSVDFYREGYSRLRLEFSLFKT